MTTSPPSVAVPVHTDRSRWIALAAVCFGMMLTFLNTTATIASVPAIGSDLNADAATTVWIPSMFVLVVASLVLSAGTLGDVIGRRVSFVGGAATMAVGSFATFLAHTSAWFLAAQAVTGIGAALVLPNSLTIISSSFADPRERTEAISIWAASSGLGLAIGPLSAGAVIDSFSWNAVFLVNAVAALVVALVSPAVVPSSTLPGARLDLPGLITATTAIAALTFWVIDGSHNGFRSPRTVISMIVFVCALSLFVTIERSVRAPMLHLDLFRSRSFSAVMLVSTTALFGFTGLSLISVLYFERVGGLSAWTTGLHLLALMMTYVVVSAIAPRLHQRTGFKFMLTGGLVITAAGALLLGRVQPHEGWATMTTAFVVLGLGIGTLIAPATAAAMNSVTPAEHGMASGTLNLFRQLGSVLGTSVMGSILTAQLSTALPTQPADTAFTSAFHTCAVVAAAVFIVVAIPTAFLVPGKAGHH
ncbi:MULTISPECIES: MFS transporter [unclassified Rhodococcus (in: high G+C Gram-positive bacteria)]|uniref:MFS transporter n=1 Tax=unclassified Rhodococcus (in: high G+C Gram-positive bacteria) TaxID=192944 RepID=UPI0016396205|nr:MULTISPECIES: MFS transporter [unclassified Rhodococcus (in: high G+C Gram-positive bacteria)]MBC2641950.1 MFS transporter [Rhodococcus sp. 3A]MBC2893309.1 MFS transporter [Rhodococcus sp. 4CII]